MKPIDLPFPQFRQNPYPIFKKLRNQSPVQKIRLSGKKDAWFITRYDDVLAVLKSRQFAKDPMNAPKASKMPKKEWMPGFIEPLRRNMLDVDAPDQTRLRKLVHKGFTPKHIEDMRERIQVLANRLLDRVMDNGTMDIIEDYALPIPTTIIAGMLGVPEKDTRKFHKWSNAIVAVESTSPSPVEKLKALPSLYAFLKYIRRLVQMRREDPQDDLISALVEAEEEGDRLDEDELVAMIFLLLVAGHETTINLIGNGVLALLMHPEQNNLIRKDAGLAGTAIEELLRFDGPLKMATERYALEDIDMGDVTIPQGDLVYAVIASANRDERFFDEPDKLDLTRTPNRHLAFGQGVHYCLGAPLARLEGEIALNTLLQRTKDIKLAINPENLTWRKGLVLRGLEHFPVSFK